MTRTTKIVLAAWAVAIALGAGWILYDSLRPAPGPGASSGLLTPNIGGPFSLIDQDGKRRGDADFRSKPMLIYFGYTYCPDVCPTELAHMANAMELLGKDADKVWPIFITVDPERDTAKVLKEYVPQFSPQLIGLTGTPEEIARVAKAYRVYYAKGKPDSDGIYMMDHSSLFYLMDGEGRFVTHFTPRTRVEDMAGAIRKLLGSTAKQN